jgi:colanic acid biosynthesis glycosyl transferase WcaI
MAEVIASCNACLVHLRRTELFETVIPSKIFEIMAMSVPIVMGVRAQAKRIMLAARAGVAMIPEDENSLLAGIEAIAGKPWAYRHGRRYVAEHFDRDVLAKRMLGELLAVAGHPDAIRPATVRFLQIVPVSAADQRQAA